MSPGTAGRTLRSGSRGGRLATIGYVARRLSGLLVTLYLIVYVARLPGDGARMMVGDSGRYGGAPFKVLELALIAALTFHAVHGVGFVVIERLAAARRHRALLIAAILVSVVITMVHWPIFFE